MTGTSSAREMPDVDRERRGQAWLVAAIVGGVVPLVQLGWFLLDNGFDTERLFGPLRHNSWALILAIDLLLSAVLFLAWSWRDSRRHGVRGWPVVLVLGIFIALSCAMPLYFWLRAREMPAS